ncbi:family 10 glycosylhydrolase [Clostridium gasigenes]|uniref:family 10 glycosylhydrolase n=1 Tax=Clostridium gasigenes TaxID=94869 RepID=UPI001C0D6DCF|nr:family 10 glycosylhydrolase [Clostridium gasigenes]MBU3135358.1 family 10 glycosylhydrolase [Clostridium gasigenes]
MKKIISKILCMAIILVIGIQGKEAKAMLNEDMQGVWITTVYNKDWPSAGSRNNVQLQKQEFIDVLNNVKAMGLNTVVVQVRPEGDALYKSNINPWSKVLTGVQGKDPGYDPLSFIVEEAHNRGIKVHAWLNPYRITTSGTDTNVLSSNHFARKNPQTVISNGKGLYYNPGLPEVRQHIVDTVDEIVRNYNVDGIHFDDYFYPGQNINDDNAYSQYSKGLDRDDFRRRSVNEMVQAVHGRIKSIKSNVEFGISPRGVWKNESSDSTGSQTNGSGQSYFDIYGDTRAWIKNNWIDYVAPQIYWEIGSNPADYAKLIPWWANEVNGTNVKLYIGQGIYKPTVAREIESQVNLNRQYSNVKGSIYYTYSDIKNNVEGVRTKITNLQMVPVDSLIGSDRYDTASKLSQSQYNKADTVIIVNGVALADGLAATPLATNLKAPILLTQTSEIPQQSRDEIKRLSATNAIIVGGNAVVSKDVENQLSSLGIKTIKRLGGLDRYLTSLEIAKYIDANLYDVKNVVVSNGYGEPDALSIASVAGRDNMPIILTGKNTFNGDIYNWLSGEALDNAYIVGGTSVLENKILNSMNDITVQDISQNRLGGADRYATNAMVIERFYGNTLDKVYASKGYQLVDSLTAGPIAALNGAPVVLCSDDLTTVQRNVLNQKKARIIIQAGGGISPTTINSLKTSLK